jgi:uncharacterized iron-regulated membrane protein
MSWWVARPHDDELVDARGPAIKLGPVLGASAVALVVLGILALLAGKGLEPFGGSVSVLAGLLCGSTLVVVGLAGVARRNAGHRAGAAARRETPQARPVDRPDPPDDRAQRVDDTRVMRRVAVGLPPPPVPPRRPSVLRTVAGPDR